MSSSKIIHLTDNNFKAEVIDSPKPVMVDFWAEWCGPCRSLAPIIDQIADEMSDKIKVCKLDVDEARETAIFYKVMSIPTVIFFKNGQVVSQQVGTTGKANYIQIINSL